MEKVRIGVVGAGRLGGFHAEKIATNPLCHLSGIFDPDPENRRRVAEKFGVPEVTTPDALLPLSDAVTIAAPSTLHGELGLFFLRNGKHILMEKPLATSAREALELAEEAKSRRLVLQTGHVERFNPAWREAIPHVTAMRERGPIFIDAIRQSIYTFRCVDVGAVLDIMIHDLDLVLSLIDSPVKSISAWGNAEFGGFEDMVAAQITFESGDAARLFASRIESGPKRQMTIRGTGERLAIDFATRALQITKTDESILRGDYAPEKVRYAEIQPSIPTFMVDHYRSETVDFGGFDALALEEDFFAKTILDSSRDESTPPTRERSADAVALAEKIIELLPRTV